MNKKDIIEKLDNIVYSELKSDSTGHDYFHIDRVRKSALKIAGSYSEADLFVVEAAALLHDIADHKFHNGDESIGPAKAKEILDRFVLDSTVVNKIVDIVANVSFKGLGVKAAEMSLEGKIVQDADRLDAIGAIGIARAFAYGGSKGRPLYNPNIKPVCHTSMAAYKTSTAPTINHFYEKLLHLKDKLNTDVAKEIAEERHIFMEDFLTHFYKEWG